MKRNLVTILLALCASVVSAQDYIVVRDGTGFGAVQAMPVDTGVRIEATLVGKLTGSELNDIMNHDVEVPLHITNGVVGWSRYYTHLRVAQHATEAAVLSGRKIQRKEKANEVGILELLNPLPWVTLVYCFLLVWIMRITTRKLLWAVGGALYLVTLIFFAASLSLGLLTVLVASGRGVSSVTAIFLSGSFLMVSALYKWERPLQLRVSVGFALISLVGTHFMM